MCVKSKLAEHIEAAMYAIAITAVISFGAVCFRLGQLDVMPPRRF